MTHLDSLQNGERVICPRFIHCVAEQISFRVCMASDEGNEEAFAKAIMVTTFGKNQEQSEGNPLQNGQVVM